MPNQYPFDPYGNNPANYITNEQIPITQVNDPQVAIVVPSAAPFFRRDLEVRYRAPGVIGEGTLMVEGIDYFLGWKFIAASRTIGEPVYGSIVMVDPTKQGSILVKNYRTLGGDWVQDPAAILNMLNSVLYHPRVTSWDEVTPQLVAFPVIEHPHDISDLRGANDLYDALTAIPPAIVSAASTGIANHLAQTNPHNITKFTINLGQVQNFPIATGAAATAALSDVEYMTPLKTRILLEAALGSAGLGGLIFGGGSGGAPAGADVTGPAGGVLANEVALFDGTTGKFIKGTSGAAIFFTAADRRGIEIRTTSSVRAAMRWVAAGGRVDMLVQSGTTGNIDINLPTTSGTLLLAEQISVAQNRVPFRSLSGAGVPDSSLVASVSATSDALVIRKSDGQITTPANPGADTDAVNRKWVTDGFVANSSNLFLRVDALHAANASPTTQSAYSSQAMSQILGDYVTISGLNQVLDDLSLSNLVTQDTDLFVRVSDLKSQADAASTTTVYSSAAVVALLSEYATSDYVLTNFVTDANFTGFLSTLSNDLDQLLAKSALVDQNATPATTTAYTTAGIASILSNYATSNAVALAYTTLTTFNNFVSTVDVGSIVRTNTNTFVRVSDLKAADATPDTVTAYSTAAVNEILEDFATETWVQQLIDDLGLDAGVKDSSLVITVVPTLNTTLVLEPNTLTIVEIVESGAAIEAPSTDVVDGDRFTVAILENDTDGVLLGGDISAPIYNNETPIIRQHAIAVSYQYQENYGWVRTGVFNFYTDTKPLKGADLRLTGTIDITSGLPNYIDYDYGTVLEVETTATVAGKLYTQGSFLIRRSNSWLAIGTSDTEELEATIDILIAGFESLTAALEL